MFSSFSLSICSSFLSIFNRASFSFFKSNRFRWFNWLNSQLPMPSNCKMWVWNFLKNIQIDNQLIDKKCCLNYSLIPTAWFFQTWMFSNFDKAIFAKKKSRYPCTPLREILVTELLNIKNNFIHWSKSWLCMVVPGDSLVPKEGHATYHELINSPRGWKNSLFEN